MLTIRKNSIFILLCAGFIFLCGCRQTIVSDADELRSYEWKAENESGTEIYLNFDLNRAVLKFAGADEQSSGEISGPCIVSDSGFIITDTSMGEIFYFTYTLSGDKVKVSYQNQEIEFDKIIVESEETEQSEI